VKAQGTHRNDKVLSVKRNHDITKCKGLENVFVITKFRNIGVVSIHFTITGLKNILRYTGVFVIQRSNKEMYDITETSLYGITETLQTIFAFGFNQMKPNVQPNVKSPQSLCFGVLGRPSTVHVHTRNSRSLVFQ